MKNIVFISGWGTNKEIWNNIKDQLKENDKIRFSYIPWNLYIQQKTTQKFNSQTIIIGWSLGALIALQLAIKNHKISKLILFSPTAYMPKEKNYNGISRRILDSMLLKLKTDKHAVLKDFAHNGLLEENKSIDFFLKQALTYSTQDLSNGIEYLKKTDIRSELKNVNTPALIFHGKNDRTIPISQALYINHNLINSKIVSLNKGHYLLSIKQSIILREIKNFICT